MLKKIISGMCAGVMIAIGGCVFLACENKIVGAILFSVALLCICWKGYSLFTGKIGYIAEAHGKEEFSVLLLGLLGNAIATIALGFAVRACMGALGESAAVICQAKLTQTFYSTFLRAFFCGVLMYMAVSIYRDNKTPLSIVYCIPVFILSGFEHSIADIFYFAASGIVSLEAFGYLWLVILGNSVGALLLCAATRHIKKQ